MKMNFIKPAAALLSSALLVSSCVNTEPDTTGYGDVYILTEIVDGDTLKGLGLHAFSYSEFTSVNVEFSGPQGQTYVLEPYMGYNQDFVWTTPANEYSETLPAAGDYVFNATFRNGEVKTFYDKLYSTLVYPPLITKCEMNASTREVELKWNKVSNADSYNVKLMNDEGDILFVSRVYNNLTEEYRFSKNTDGWQAASYPADGDSVVVELVAYLLEPATMSNDLQCIGKSKKTIVWKD